MNTGFKKSAYFAMTIFGSMCNCIISICYSDLTCYHFEAISIKNSIKEGTSMRKIEFANQLEIYISIENEISTPQNGVICLP